MARVAANALIEGFSGSIGNLVFRQVGNSTVVGKKSFPRKKQSELQRGNREKFREATRHAKQAMNDPQRKAYYQQKAKKLNLPNAYTAAITDYMRKGAITEVSIKPSEDKSARTIVVKTEKKHFSINNLRLTVRNKEGRLVHFGQPLRKGHHHFEYTLPEDVDHASHTIRVIIDDFRREDVFAEIEL